MTVEQQERTKVRQQELPVLAGSLEFLKTMVDIEHHVDGEESYRQITQTMEDALKTCVNIADRLLYAGIEEE